jgi:hypothetical protein
LHPKTALSADPVKGDRRLYQRDLMAKKRASQRDIFIPPPIDPARRLKCEADPALWLSTYFPEKFFEGWTEDRLAMVHSIIDAALYGGDQSIAGPRGEGKTTLAILTALYLMVRRLSTFPVAIGKNADKAKKEVRDIVEQLQQNEIFAADYPEIAIPFQAVGGWSSRGRMQTCGGMPTNIVIGPEFFVFPTIGRDQLQGWPTEIEPASCGQVLYSLGIDGAIRGTKYRSRRPTLAIIDDIEDREAAASETTIEKNEEVIEQDIAGLGQSSERIPRVMLCTIQNRKCIAYRYTDPKQKPSWRGKRYRKLVTKPDRMDLIEKYIDMRKGRKDDDPDAREAFRFWRDNQEDIERGSVVSNPNSYSKKTHSDGEPMELSAVHSYFNRVADRGQKAVSTEDDNDPPEQAGPMGLGITPALVESRISGLVRRQLPANTVALTAAIDLGKYYLHWVVSAWWHGAGGVVADYGIQQVYGTDKSMNHEASEPMIYQALLSLRDELLTKEFSDTTGTRRTIDFCFVDSGAFTNAAYQFCREVGGIFHPSKGQDPYHRKAKSTSTTIAGANLHAQKLPSSNVWLYELDTSYWKQFIHERFMTPTFDESNMLRRGSLSLFALEEERRHSQYSQHIAAEELVTKFTEGKGAKTYWMVKDSNNHWLDATYMAAAASEACGVKLIAPSEIEVQPKHVSGEQPKQTKPAQQAYRHGQQRFKQRQGGWIPKRRG